MRITTKRASILALSTAIIASLSVSTVAQQTPQTEEQPKSDITVTGEPILDPATMTKGPEVKGIIAARRDDKLKITTDDGSSRIIALTDATKIKSRSGGKLGTLALLNGLPITIKTLQSGDNLVASQIRFRGNDLKTAKMIRTGTAEQFEQQTAATQALRGRMGDIDKYDVKSTMNVNFDTGKAVLSPQAKQELCSTAAQADATENALMLVVGYTDSVGSEEYNQMLSDKRAGSVINYLQQACRWKPYRMLTPTGMAEADPLASNDTVEGKAQNRRVSVNILVSKALDGL
jgi:OmpA-OmpF porin, OOP family